MRSINVKEVRSMLESASNNLQNSKKLINDLNVFPVPDGDTGTNMGLTFGSASREALEYDGNVAGKMMEILAKSSLRNARGNSGVILSQILRGISVALAGKSEFCVEDIKNAACGARDTAYRAIMKPTEGTILTVIREGAEFAEDKYGEYDDATKFFSDILGVCRESLKRTPDILPILKQAGVVDAGGCGAVILLEGAEAALSGRLIALKDGVEVAAVPKKAAAVNTDIRYKYCTEFLIQKSSPDRQSNQFTAAIRAKGDCMLVIDDDEIVKVHIHTNHPGFIMEEAIKLGELINIKVDNMKYQHNEIIGKNEAEEEVKHEEAELKKYGVVAVSAGDGIAEVFKSVNTDMIVEGGQTMNPSTQDLLDAVNKVSAKTVYILPNNKNIILAAEQVDEICDKDVRVIPTKNIPQGISAMLAFDETADEAANTEAMTEMMSAVKCGQVTFAARDSVLGDMEIHEGDVMGMVGSEISALGNDLNKVSEELADKLIDDDTAMVTIYYGRDTDEKTAGELAEMIEQEHRDIDVSVVMGGQPVYYYIIAVE